MRQFFIRHKPTGFYIPNSNGGKGLRDRKSSAVEPMPQKFARVFQTKHAATSFLNQWVKGIHSYKEDYFGEIDFKITPVASRKREDMEIVEIEINIDNHVHRRHSCVTTPSKQS